jgi:hypothetical protein
MKDALQRFGVLKRAEWANSNQRSLIQSSQSMAKSLFPNINSLPSPPNTCSTAPSNLLPLPSKLLFLCMLIQSFLSD